MKRTYQTPETQSTLLTLENNFLATGENLSSRNYGDGSGEDKSCFWE